MCEVAILDPEQYSTSEIKSAAMTLYEAMRHSLGVVSISESDDGTKFEYDTYKAVEPDLDDLLEFVEGTKEDGAFRVVIHGRLATRGEVRNEHAHPLEVDCPKCNVDMVVHNGVIRAFDHTRNKHEDNGHVYSTNVDSEAIAHDFGDVPTSFDFDAPAGYSMEPAFVLFNEDAVLAQGNHYQLTNDFRMAQSRRDFGPDRREDDYQRVILTPSQA